MTFFKMFMCKEAKKKRELRDREKYFDMFPEQRELSKQALREFEKSLNETIRCAKELGFIKNDE